MKTLYWCNEDDMVYSLDDIRKDYPEFKNEYQSFGEYLDGCMWWNNGALYPLTDRIKELQTMYDRKQMIGYKYGFELVDEELDGLRSELDELKRLYEEV